VPHRFLDDLAWADLAFAAEGRTLAELFEAAGRAVTEAMVRDLASIGAAVEREIALSAESPEALLHAFLEEIVYLKDAEGLLLSGFAIRVGERNGRWELDGHATGETIDPSRHATVVDVKAITWHKFELARAPEGGWRAQVVLDV